MEKVISEFLYIFIANIVCYKTYSNFLRIRGHLLELYPQNRLDTYNTSMEADKPINKSEEYWTENLVPVEANHNQTKHSDQQERLYSNAGRIVTIQNDTKNKTQISKSIVQKNNQSTSTNNHRNSIDNPLRIHYDDIRDKNLIGTSQYEYKLYAYVIFLEYSFFFAFVYSYILL